MKKMTFFALLISLSAIVSAQQTKPDLKVHANQFNIKHSKYPYKTNFDRSFRLTPGDVITLNVGISNNGKVESGKFKVEVKLQNHTRFNKKAWTKHQTFQKIFPSLLPGENTFFKQGITINTKNGDIAYDVKILNLEKEDLNPSDNQYYTGSILVWKEGFISNYLLPDLSIELTSPDTVRHIGRTIQLLAKVSNNGNAESPPTKIVLKCKEKKTITKDVPVLKPGESFQHEFQHKWDLLGKKKYTATVDPKNQIKEFRENKKNNKDVLQVYIK